MIDVTGINMVEFVQKVYELSRPIGMGFLHHRPCGLSDDDAKAFILKDGSVSLDYVKGRSCKMHVRCEDGKMSIGDGWFDHTDAQLAELLAHFKLSPPAAREHGCACNCAECNTQHTA